MKTMRMYGDGGSRGNPGPSASGVVIYDLVDGEEGEKIIEFGKYIGIATNNQAEYTSIILGLKKAKELGCESLDVRLDSELAVKQLNGEYRVKNAALAKLFIEIHNIRHTFKHIRFTHVRREFNKEADAMVNLALDEQAAL
jgi:ribonuclease HI